MAIEPDQRASRPARNRSPIAHAESHASVPEMIRTNGLNHLALPVRDPEASARFYAELFNMKITHSSPTVAFVKTIGATDMIALSRSDAEVGSSRDTMHFGFWVDPEQFDEAVSTIEEQGIKKVSEPSRREIGRYIFIEDLDGYTVEIFECLTPPYSEP